MKIRDTVIDYQHTFTTPARVWTIPINIVDPVTEFKVYFEIHTSELPDEDDPFLWAQPVPYMIEEIAIIDGSEVIFALNGAEMFAMSCYDLGYAPYHDHNEIFNRVSKWCFPIHFGRSLVDPNWIFNPRAFKNPQMRITWDSQWQHLNQAGTYKIDDDHPISITIWAKIMEEGASPVGYLMTKEVKEYTPTGPGDEITWLPTDFPIRKLMVRSYAFGLRQHRMVDHLKLSQDQDKWIPFDHDGADFIWLMKNWFTEVQLAGHHFMENDSQREHLAGSFSSGLVVGNARGWIVCPNNWIGNTFWAYVQQHDGVLATTTTRVEAESACRTRTPFDCFCYPFGDQEDPADWLEVGEMGNLRLILSHLLDTREGQTGYGLTQIVCQQAHPY